MVTQKKKRINKKKKNQSQTMTSQNNNNKITVPTKDSITNVLHVGAAAATATDQHELQFHTSVKEPPPKKRKLLNFDYTQVRNEQWEKKFGWLVEYKKAHKGSTLVPHIYDANPELGMWTSKQRVTYKEKKLSTERINRLNGIGFVWKVCTQVPWIESYNRLVAYKEKYGTTVVPQIYPEDPSLGLWVTKQRQRCKKEDRIQLLKDIDFVWDARPDGGWKRCTNR